MTAEEIIEILEAEKDHHSPDGMSVLLSDKLYRYGVLYGLNLAISYIKRELPQTAVKPPTSGVGI